MPVEGVDGLERPERRVELRRVTVERVECRLDALTVVTLPRDGQILDPRQVVRLVLVRRRPVLGHRPSITAASGYCTCSLKAGSKR